MEFPFEINPVEADVNSQLLRDFTGERTGFVQVGAEKWFFPSGFVENAPHYYNFTPRSDDVWVVSFPRSGTTWTQELVWLLSNNLDYMKASQIPLELRFPFLEFSSFIHPDIKKELLEPNKNVCEHCRLIEALAEPAWKTLEKPLKRRFIKTHLPFELLHPDLLHSGSKVIYIARNVKDVVVSFYHLNKLFRTQGYTNDFNSYWNYFRNGLQPWTPYWSHIKQGWKERANKNVLFMFYEDMSQKTEKSIRRMADFLEVEYSSHQLEKLQKHLRIDNFKTNPSVNGEWLNTLGITLKTENGFIRNGRNGASQEYFTGNLSTEIDTWIRDNLKDTDMQFPSI